MWRPQGAQLPSSGISHFRLDPALGHRQCSVCENEHAGGSSFGEGRFALGSHSPWAIADAARYGRSRQCATRYESRPCRQIQVFSSPPKLLTGSDAPVHPCVIRLQFNNSSLSCGASKRERLAEYKAESGCDRKSAEYQGAPGGAYDRTVASGGWRGDRDVDASGQSSRPGCEVVTLD